MNIVRRLFSFEIKDIIIFNGNSTLYSYQESLRLKFSWSTKPIGGYGGCQYEKKKSNLTYLINKRSYSSHSDSKIVLSPNFVTGFTDAEGCFFY